jgi:hypothetical protein
MANQHFKTPITEMFKIQHPIILAGMNVAAVLTHTHAHIYTHTPVFIIPRLNPFCIFVHVFPFPWPQCVFSFFAALHGFLSFIFS